MKRIILAALACYGAGALLQRLLKPKKEKVEEFDRVDEASQESFPASDPPAY